MGGSDYKTDSVKIKTVYEFSPFGTTFKWTRVFAPYLSTYNSRLGPHVIPYITPFSPSQHVSYTIDNIRPIDWKLNKRPRSKPRFAPLVL